MSSNKLSEIGAERGLRLLSSVGFRTSLEKNPFNVLEASPRDSRAKLAELAEEKGLVLQSEITNKARTALTSLRSRLVAEVGWFPGLAPLRAQALVTNLRHDVNKHLGLIDTLPPLARANLMASITQLLNPVGAENSTVAWCVKLATTIDEIDTLEVLKQVNEDRQISGFPPINDVSQLESALAEQRSNYKDALSSLLAELDQGKNQLSFFEAMVSLSTNKGTKPAPSIIEELGEQFRVLVDEQLRKGAAEIKEIIEQGKKTIEVDDETSANTVISRLLAKLKAWYEQAQPLQLLGQGRGVHHELSRDLAHEVCDFAIDLVNEYSLMTTSRALLVELKKIFAELPLALERIDENLSAVQKMIAQEGDASQRVPIFRAEIGLVSKTTLYMDSHELRWGDYYRFKLKDVTRIRLGAVSRSFNGIPTGTTYTLAFGDEKSLAVCETRRSSVYSEFSSLLLSRVVPRILQRRIKELTKKKKWGIGKTEVYNEGIRLYWNGHSIFLSWKEVWHDHVNGSLIVGCKGNQNIQVDLPFKDTDNAVILSTLLQILEDKKSPRPVLSECFE